MTKRLRNWLAVLGIVALLLTAIAFKPSATVAANLTGGNYTYLIDGEEVTFTFDPVVRSGGLLLPVEVFQQLGITVDGATDKTVTLTKDTVVASVTVGKLTYDLSGQTRTLGTAALRLNGRVFLPAELMKEFGVEFLQDNTLLSFRTYVDTVPPAVQLDDNTWNSFPTSRGLSANVRSDAGVYLSAKFMLMNDAMVNATNLGTSYGVRARLNSLMPTNTLVYVTLSNTANKAGGLVTTGLYLIDDQRHQYDLNSVIDLGNGLLSNKLTPAADRTGVLVFPKLPDNVKNIYVYYDSNGALLGSFPVTK